MKLMIINGPNLNMLGIREPQHYGNTTYNDLVSMIQSYCDQRKIETEFHQSNHEGDLIDYIQSAYYNRFDGIIINPGGYTHTSVAILDAVKSVSIPTVEVHISKVNERESFRQISFISLAAIKTIAGEGTKGYLMAVDALIEHLKYKRTVHTVL